MLGLPWKKGLYGAVSVNQEAEAFSDFDFRAFAALPMEELFYFAKVLAEGQEQFQRDAGARPKRDELALPSGGWKLVIPSNSGQVLRLAAENFRSYLAQAMQTQVTIEPRASLANWSSLKQVIVAAPRNELPGYGAELKGSKDYQIEVSPGRVLVCGFDERGAMHGLYNLQARMNLREAPFLPAHLKTVRHSLYKARMTLSGIPHGEWTDEYFALLARYGFDSIFASQGRNPNGAPNPSYYGTRIRPVQDPAVVRDLITRAARYGIDLYCPIEYRWTGDPENELGLRKLVCDIVTQFPEIRGYVLLTEGFWYNTWFGAGGHGNIDLRDWVKHWAKGVAVVCEECHKINPAIEVLPWDYNIDFRPNQVDVKRSVITALPSDAIPLLTFENGKAFTFDGETGYLRDYSINEIGPSEVTKAQIAEVRRRGMRVYAKADTWASWQYGTFPYLPFPYQWYDRYQALEKYQIDGTMESWTYGFNPNFISEMRLWYSWSDAPPLDDLLRAMARRGFGAGSEERVLQAWNHFSAAIRQDPNTGPTFGGNSATGNPLFFEKPDPPTPAPSNASTGRDVFRSDPTWPYLPRGYLFTPDFSNGVNKAEAYVRPFTLPVFTKYLGLSADEMERGLASYRRAALAAPASKKKRAFREVLLAEQIERMTRSNRAVLEFEDLRFRLHTSESGQQAEILQQMSVVLHEEIKRTAASLEATRRDSRIGYESEQGYFYSPEALEEKLKLLKLTLEEQIPAYRKEHGVAS
jgi:hypothetical protein